MGDELSDPDYIGSVKPDMTQQQTQGGRGKCTSCRAGKHKRCWIVYCWGCKAPECRAFRQDTERYGI